MEKKSKIKEISMMVYRKYTEDFDSLGYRLGIALEVKDGDARDVWYQGRLFLGERITEEELLIDKKFEWLKEKKKGFPDVKVETDVIVVRSKPEGMNLVEIPMGKDVVGGEKERSVIDVKKIIATSPKAVLVLLFDGVQKWIPKSCIKDGDIIDSWEKNVKTMLFVDKWFLEKEGIIGKDAEIKYDVELKKQYEGRY